MKLKINEILKLVTPRFETDGNILTLKITDKLKSLILPIKIDFISYEPVLVAIFGDDYYNRISSNVDTTFSRILRRLETPGVGLGFTYLADSFVPKYLQSWTGPIQYSSVYDEMSDLITGLTYMTKYKDEIDFNPPRDDGKGGTLSVNGFAWTLYTQSGYYYGPLCPDPNDPNCGPESIIKKYDHRARIVNLDGTRGITLRGGTLSYFIQPKTIKDVATIKTPIYPSLTVSSTSWTNPRNKLLYYLSENDTLDQREYDARTLSLKYRYANSMYNVSSAADNRSGYKNTLENIQIMNMDIFDTLKNITNILKTRTPLIRPQNSTSSTTNSVTWFNGSPGTKYGYGFGTTYLNAPIGQTLDWNNSTGSSLINTWSPDGITASQGYYLFEGWSNRQILDLLHPIVGVTFGVLYKNLLDDSEWNLMFKNMRTVLWKEVSDRVIHTMEGRPWFINYEISSGTTARDLSSTIDGNGILYGYFSKDIDNLGFLNNQFLTPVVYTGLLAAFLYKYSETTAEQNAARKVYNLVSEIIAAYILRSIRHDGEKKNLEGANYNPTGGWLEGWAYSNQSQQDINKFLYCALKMGDYRFWGLSGGAGADWIDNQWKYYHYTILPNNLIPNSQSCPSSAYESVNNSYQYNLIPSHWTSILISKTPTPGTTGSAVSETAGYVVLGSGAEPIVPYKIWKYLTGITVSQILPNWAFISTEKMMIWHSEVPKLYRHSNNHRRAVPETSPTSYVNKTKPPIFSVWTKAGGSYEMKAHRDSGHVSAYLGDAVILLETGEDRTFINNRESEFLANWGSAKGHNVMQLGEIWPSGQPREGTVLNYGGGTTYGYISMDTTNSYNTKGLTTNPPPVGGFKTSNWLPRMPYQYQISKCTRGITWNYDSASKFASMSISDYVGLSGICGPAESLSTRKFYRFHLGYNKFGIIGQGITTNGWDDIGETNGRGLQITPTSVDWKNWSVSWDTETPFNLNMKAVGITMSIQADKPIWITKEIATSFAFKNSVPSGLCYSQQKHYSINIGLTGATANPYNLTLYTNIQIKGHTTSPYSGGWLPLTPPPDSEVEYPDIIEIQNNQSVLVETPTNILPTSPGTISEEV